MNQSFKKILRGYGQTFRTVARLIACGQIAIHKLAGIPVNMAAYLLNRPPPLLPPVLQIDITDMCNLRCPGCLTGMGFNQNSQGLMAYENFQALVDEVSRSTALVVLYNSGEPLLHPDVLKMIRHLTRNRIASVISTNGHFVKTRGEAEALVVSGLSVMIVSLSGATQKVYEQYHQGGNLDQVIRGVRYVKAARENLKKKTPLIIFRFLVMPHNIHQADAMAALAKSAGCDWFEFREVNWRAYLTEDPSTASLHKGHRPEAEISRRCLWPWLISVVNWNGDAYPCCFYKLGLPGMGNTVEGGGIKAVWKSNAYNRFRKEIRTETDRPAACLNCPAETGFQTRFSRQNRTLCLYHSKKPGHKEKT